MSTLVWPRLPGFARVSAAVPPCRVGDPAANVLDTLALLQEAHEQDAAVVVFPELGLTGYTARDLFHDLHLLRAAERSLAELAEATKKLGPMALVGLPVLHEGGLFNVAVAVQGGRLLGAVPKAYLPNYREFEETRWFRSGLELPQGGSLSLAGQTLPFGMDLLFAAPQAPDLVVGVEICEDLWVQVPPSSQQVSAGATVVCNLSASNFTVGKSGLRRMLARSMSDRGKCAYVYVAAGPGESSTDLAFDAEAFVCENGSVVADNERFRRDGQLVTYDVDLEALVRDRLTFTSFGDCAREHRRTFRRIDFDARPFVPVPLRRHVARHPFIPADEAALDERCWETFEIQTNALATRMQAIGEPKLVLGLSGGVDSTHAALVSAGALDLLGRPRADLVAVTMPGLGTTTGTRSSAQRLAKDLGCTLRTVPISEVSHTVLDLIGHPAANDAADVKAMLQRLSKDPDLADVTVENVQARLRTLVLMTVANAEGGLVVGTGDLSEKALGWATYAGDQIAMYDVNAGVPKTLIQFVIRWVANQRVSTWSTGDPEDLRRTLFAVLDTPISPELLPADAQGSIAQLTEESIGPYELHDFYLYHFVRHGARPARILDLARHAFGDDYEIATLKRWLRVFVRRFFAHQFKRSATADAPKVGQVALSPRGDWRMPSDASSRSWLAEIDAYPES